MPDHVWPLCSVGHHKLEDVMIFISGYSGMSTMYQISLTLSFLFWFLISKFICGGSCQCVVSEWAECQTAPRTWKQTEFRNVLHTWLSVNDASKGVLVLAIIQPHSDFPVLNWFCLSYYSFGSNQVIHGWVSWWCLIFFLCSHLKCVLYIFLRFVVLVIFIYFLAKFLLVFLLKNRWLYWDFFFRLGSSHGACCI